VCSAICWRLFAVESGASDIATRPVESCDQANTDRIGSAHEYDRRRRGCGFACLRRRSAGPHDRGHLPAATTIGLLLTTNAVAEIGGRQYNLTSSGFD
jgi:hypothetical protein